MFQGSKVNRRLLAAGAHLLASALVATTAAILVFLVWYPAPFATIAGGTTLFSLLIAVDVILGPALTLVVANPRKSRRELTRDLMVIVAFQLAGFSYGIHAMALARPVILSFEIDRFRLVTAVEIDPVGLPRAPDSLKSLSWTGPRLIGAVKPTNPDEQFRSIELGMNGIDLSMVPANWVPYAQVSEAVLRKARPVSTLIHQYPAAADAVKRTAATAGVPLDKLRFLPLVSRQASGVTLVSAPNAQVVGYLPLEGFF